MGVDVFPGFVEGGTYTVDAVAGNVFAKVGWSVAGRVGARVDARVGTRVAGGVMPAFVGRVAFGVSNISSQAGSVRIS